jgi:L-fuculose-phosphate aldolase
MTTRRPATISTHQDLMQALSWAGAKAAGSGLVIGSGGNLSARLPGSDAVVITASGTWLDELDEDDFSIVRLDGTVVAGNPTPSSEFRLHLDSYRARPDVNALIHLHPQTSVLLHALGHPIRMITIDQTYYVRHVATTPWIPSGSEELARAGAEALTSANAVILGNHGCSVVADSVELAYKRAANLEEAALATYRALTLGDEKTECPPAYRDLLAARETDPVLRLRH